MGRENQRQRKNLNHALISSFDFSFLDFDLPIPFDQAEERVKNRESSARMSEHAFLCEFRSSPVFRER